jgi:hypothetical protein
LSARWPPLPESDSGESEAMEKAPWPKARDLAALLNKGETWTVGPAG